jgi:hypothetical protein
MSEDQILLVIVFGFGMGAITSWVQEKLEARARDKRLRRYRGDPNDWSADDDDSTRA